MSWKRVKQTLSKFGTNLFSLKNRKSLRKKKSLGKRRRTMGGTKAEIASDTWYQLYPRPRQT